MIKNCITFIFNHSSTELYPCKQSEEEKEEEKIENKDKKKSYYEEDVIARDFSKISNQFL